MEWVTAVAVKLLPGFGAGLATLFVGQPFDTVKVRLQTSSTAKPPSFMAAAAQCVREEGAAGLYKGTSPQLLGSMVQHGVRYSSYRAAREQLALHSDMRNPTICGLVSGVATGCAVSIIATPVELIKCRQQMSFKRHLTISEVIKTALREEGPRGLMRGFMPTLLRSTLGNAAAFGAYETCVESGLPVPLAGGVAGMCFWTIGFPADLIKSHVQIGAGWAGIRSRGLRGYFRGYSAVLLRAFPTNAAAFWTFSWCERSLGLLKRAPS